MPKKNPVSAIDRALASVLKGAYKVKGLTQDDLVRETGITATTMQRLMAGNTGWDIEQLFAVADAIGWKDAADYMREAEELAASAKPMSADSANVTRNGTRKGDDWQGEEHALEEWDAAAKPSNTVIEISPDDVTP
ncbi:helix-turn-helix domain-containing protein [Leifsonia sp. TF02-11]|uniref:helix-turn-helix domain-containing protein n=1 Tax=Leifsonia sp. TF02-11 TaxID=2815212 RepID=UPI001AA1C3BF|nr:helix-turn-helix transcriptional regulator [Leifsonia sp. TF02-11]MBO1739711.1 helix-turn-helix transcriptional regulator [Leifsonia sp. TF02-11]